MYVSMGLLIDRIGGYTVGDEAAMEMKTGPIVLHKLSHLHIMGPNGSGKSTLLEAIYNSWQQQRKDKSFIFKGAALSGEVPPIIVNGNATVGYYRQDFNNLDHNSTAIHCMQQASDGKHSEQDIRRSEGTRWK
jgi:ATPase subunit of ABC transporter with duplicated ATPase domains